MRKLQLLFFLLCMSSLTFSQKWVKVWGDEFNTPGLPDTTRWDYEVGKVRNSELQYYTYRRSENARIQDTVLIIEARKEPYQGASYTSASLISKYKGDWQYGKFEIRAKVPTGKGTWPAIWMMPTDSEYGGWPRSGEIDIMEYVGMNPSNLYFTVHFEGTNGSGHQSSGNSTTAISQPYNKFITYTLIWSPDKLEFYADGVKYHTYSKLSDDPKVWPFNKLFFMILNLAYGGSWGAQQGIDDTKLPHKFYIDYVRVYQLESSSGPHSLNVEPANGGSVDVSPKQESYTDGSQVTLTAKPDPDFVFDKWLHLSAANPLKLDMVKSWTITPLFRKKNELLTNGDFTQGLKSWGNLYLYNAQTKGTASVTSGLYTMNVTAPGTAGWHIVDQQLQLHFLQNSTYKVTFDAWADNPNAMDVFVSKNYGDYSGYYSTVKNITQTRQSFSWTFTMNYPTDMNCRFGFGFGKFTGKIYLDNVSIARVVPTEARHLSFNSEAQFQLFPNPTSGNVLISDLPQTLSVTTLRLFNLYGQLVSTIWKDKPLSAENSYPVNLAATGISKGIYLLQLSDRQKTFTRKLILD